MKTIRFIAVLLFASALPIYSQQPVRESVQVTLVEVPVTVADRNGNPVRGLTKENFELVDEKEKRPIAYFEEIDLTAIETDSTPSPMNPAARRNFLILFDLSNSKPGNVVRARDAAKDFVTNQAGARDLVAVATFSIESGFRLLTTFTTDRELVRIAIDTLGNPKFFKNVDPLYLSALMTPESSMEVAEGGAGSRPDQGAIDAEILSQLQQQEAEYARMSGRADEEFRRGRIRRQLRNFGGFAKALDSVSGRKQVILLSEGFEARLVQGRSAGTSGEAATDAMSVVRGEAYNVDTDAIYGNTSSANEVNDMANLFKRSDVVLHAIDIKGLRAADDSGESRSAGSNESLFLITNPTGGHVFKNANDLTTNFKKMLKQQEVVYILGFQAPSTGNAGKFHNLKVKLVNVPGGARASHRAGYYEPSSQISPLEEALAASAILVNDIAQTEVPFSLMAVPFPTQKSNPRVPVIVEIPGRQVLEGATGNQISGDLLVYAFTRDNVVKDFRHQRVSLDLSKVRDSLATGGIKYYGTLSLPPGDYVIKALFRVLETGRTGFQRTELQVPQFSNAVVLPPFIYEEGAKWLMVKDRPRNVDEVEYPFEVAGESFIPAATPRFKEGQAYKVALFTYNVPPDAMQLDASIRGASGQKQKANVSLVGRTKPDAHGATKLLLNFTPTGLAPGAYTLDVAVGAKNGAMQVASTRFVIE